MHFVLMLATLIGSSPAPAELGWRDADGRPIKPAPDHASNGDFGTMQIVTTDPEKLETEWAKPTPGVNISTQDITTRNQPIFSFIVFRGCRPGLDGNCNVTVHFEILDPAGKAYGVAHDGPAWSAAAPPLGNLQLSEGAIGLRIEAGEKLGKYQIIAQTTDHIANITLTTKKDITVNEAPGVGGWSEIAHPMDDANVRAAANAMVTQLPLQNAKLHDIKSALQKNGADTNYRLILILTDGTHWSALVNRKSDGTFVVEVPSMVQ